MDKEVIINVTNRDNGRVFYEIPELGVIRGFAPNETKEIEYSELRALSFAPGGTELLKDYLILDNQEAVKLLLNHVEPEYYYTETEVKNILQNGTQDAFLDCLDFAPTGVIELIKDLAVSLPLNDMAKREAIKEKTGFDVTRAIEIKNTKYDGGDEATETTTKAKRRVAVAEEESTGRRVEIPQYNIVK